MSSANFKLMNPRMETRGLLQVDIVGHSGLWKRTAANSIMEMKVFFAECLTQKLETASFRLVAWAGDGGIFSAKCGSVTECDKIIDSSRYVFEALEETKLRYQNFMNNVDSISIRSSAHIGEIYVVDNPQYWHGSELNFFVKNERLLSEPGMFAITDALRERLSFQKQLLFPEDRSIQRVIGDRQIKIFFHKNYSQDDRNFDEIGKILIPSSVAWNSELIKSDPQHASFLIGNCIVFDQARLPDGYISENFRIDTQQHDYDLPEELKEIVSRYAEKQIGTNFPHYRLNYFKHPHTDFPIIEIGLSRTWYIPIRSIQSAIEDDPNQQVNTEQGPTSLINFLSSLNPLDFSGNRCPNHLAVHLAIITSEDYHSAHSESYQPQLVLVQRGPARQVGYYPEAWSVSIQEAVKAPGAIQSIADHRLHDRDLYECAQRAVDEELLGLRVDRHNITFHCFFLEAEILGQGCFGICQVPVSFDELCRRRRRLAPDSRESSCLAAVPLRQDVLMKLFSDDEIDLNYVREIGATDPESSTFFSTEQKTWHPSAKLALFMLIRRYFPLQAEQIMSEVVKNG